MNRRDFLLLSGAAANAALCFGRQEKDPRVAARMDLPVDEQHPVSERGRELVRMAHSLRIEKDIPYVQRPQRTLHVSVYTPSTKAAGPWPVILNVGLAAWQTDTSDFRLNLDAVGPAPTPNIYPPVLASLGYALVAAQLRTSGEACFPAQIQDCQAALAWILREAPSRGFDTTRIGLIGASASGHLVSLLALMNGARGLLDPSLKLSWPLPVKAVCSMSGFYDFVYYRRDPGDGTLYPQIQRFLGGTYEERPEIYQEASPQYYLQHSPATPIPAFFMDHGVQDRRVPYSQAVRFHQALSAAKASVAFEAIDHYHHGPQPGDIPDPPYSVTDQRIYEFFDQHLKGVRWR
jgi:acetyl esterase/lipase